MEDDKCESMKPKEHKALFIENRVHVLINPVMEGEPTELSNADMGYPIYYKAKWMVFYSYVPCQVYFTEYMEINLN